MPASKVTAVFSLLAILSIAPLSHASSTKECSPALADADASATFLSDTGNLTTLANHNTTLSVGIYAPGSKINPGNKTSTSILLGVDTKVDYSDKNLPFSACALIFDQLPSQGASRGQEDDGTCHSIVSPSCTAALQMTASELAFDITKNSSQAFTHNNTFSTLPSVCNYLADQMSVALPNSCKGQNQSAEIFLHAEAIPITGTPALNPCHEAQTSTPSTTDLQNENIFSLYNTITETSPSSDPKAAQAVFGTAASTLYPVMRVYMPAVNGNYSKSFVKMDYASADLVCLQPKNVTDLNGSGKTSPTSKISKGSKKVVVGTGQAAVVALGVVGLVMVLAA